MEDISSLIEKFTSGDDAQAEAAASALASRGSDALPVLRALLQHENADVRWWATRALAEVEDPAVAGLLKAALHDPDSAVRYCAALAARRQPATALIPDLIAMLGEEDRMLARLAADALITAGKPAVPPLLDLMRNGSQAARLEAVRALAGIGDTRAIPALFEALGEESALMEYWAGEGLERMGVGTSYFIP
jgi:HEAT repeat protein